MQALRCPECSDALTEDDPGMVCGEGHRYSELGFALAANVVALKAVWAAIRALEDDAAGLEYMAERDAREQTRGVAFTASRREEADGARQAARVLRTHAAAAQDRLDALPAPSPVERAGSTEADQGFFGR